MLNYLNYPEKKKFTEEGYKVYSLEELKVGKGKLVLKRYLSDIRWRNSSLSF